MKNNLETGSGTTRQRGQAFYARFTPDRVCVGIASLLLLLLSLLGMIVTCTRTDVIAASVKSSAYSGTKHTLAPGDTTTPTTTPTLTPTLTASPTSTPSPTATPTMLPTPTSTPKPSPTATSKPSPTVTIVPTALPTSSTSSTPSISPTHASKKAVTHATPVAASIGPASSSQSSVQSQTPTTTPNPQTPQEHQNKTFPFIAFAIGVPGITATLVFLFIGWWLLRKRLIPQSNVKLPPSGASPWSRVRPNDTLNTTINNTLSLDDTNAQLSLSNNKMPLGSNGSAPFDVNIAPPAIDIVPTFNGFVNNNTDSVVPTVVQLPANEMNQIRNTRLIPIPDGISETNIPPIVSENSSSGNDEDAYEQWLHNNNARNPDLNDVYLKELIKQFSDKSRAAHQQNEANFRNEQTV